MQKIEINKKILIFSIQDRDLFTTLFEVLDDEHARLADEEWRRLNTVMEDPDCPEKPYKRYMDLTRFQNPELYRQRKRRRVVKQFRYNSATRTMTEE